MDSLHLDDERSNNKMISTPREKVFQAKQDEGDTNESSNKLISKQPIPPPSSISSSRQWSGLISRNPRIVRVSRSFGGKDRHSKVCTIRGLRDRRIRLSIPTAIQLYDLQDRLGLTQPSKVIDWLLDVTKHDIDNLPPLQIPQGLLGHNQQQPTMHSVDQWDLAAPSASVMMRAKGKEVERDHDQDDQDKNAMPLLNPYIYYHNWEPSNLSLSQQAADQNSVLNSNVFPFFCPPSAAVATMPSVFPTYVQEGTHDDQSSRQLINHFQLWSSSNSSQQVKRFSLNVNPGHTESNPGKEDT